MIKNLKIILCAILSKRNISTTLLSLLCIIFFITTRFNGLVTFGGTEHKTVLQYIFSSTFYSFSHVNIFHLGINLFALYQFRPRISTALAAFAIAFLVPLLGGSLFCVPTCGISVLLYGAVSRFYVAWNRPVWNVLWANLLLCGINFVMGETYYNWQAHIIAFAVGYLIWYLIYHYKKS